MDLTGKKAVVIGASGGIGRVLSLALALEGVEMILVGRDKKTLYSLKDKITQKKGLARVLVADVAKVSGVKKISSYVRKNYKYLDILIHAAGIGVYKKLEDTTGSEWKKSFDINVTSVFLITQSLLPLLKRSEKSFVLATGSGMGKIAVASRSPYCASKFALRGLMLSLAKEFKSTNINIVLLTLGSVLTSFGPLSIEDKEKKVQEGKAYLKPSVLAHSIVSKLKHDTLEPETSIYPSDYLINSKKGKT